MAKNLKHVNWSKLLKVDPIKFKEWFNLIEKKKVKGLKVKFYSLKFRKDEPDYEGFIRYMYEEVETYVFDDKEIKEIRDDGDNPQQKALSYFGDINPTSDGSYGELILYLFVEAVLRTPLVVHKVSQTYSDNEQVKGSDGIFIGKINNKTTLLIGESKMRNNFNKCVSDTLESLFRYIDKPEAIDRELAVAKKHLSKDLDNLDQGTLDLIYQSFRTKQPEFRKYELCYPAFLMYKENKINEMITERLPNIEREINNYLASQKKKRVNYISNSLPDLKDITLEFFMMPVKNVNDFRKLCYDIFHEDKS